MTGVPLIPAWLIAILAFATGWSLWLVRPMPRLVRISIIVPIIYFGILYLYVQTLPDAILARTELVRLGLILIFLPIITNSILVRWKWFKGGRHYDNP